MDVRGLCSQAWPDMVKMKIVSNRGFGRADPHKWTVADDFPSYRCTICHAPLRYAEDAYCLDKEVNEKHAWACKACLQERGLIW